MNKIKLSPVLFILVCAIYWLYLLSSTNMVIKFDAQGYEDTGRLIADKGIEAFFTLLPDKVILYPLTVAISMKIADALSISYQIVQAVFQILCLFISQLLIWKILKEMGVNKLIIGIALLYFGISPGMVNSALSLYCEIISYPTTLAAVLLSILIWQAINKNSLKKALVFAVLLAFTFSLLSLTRPVNEYIFFFFMIGFMGLSLKFIFQKQFKIFINLLITVIFTLILFNAMLLPYKNMQLKYNGYKMLTPMGHQSLYATAIGRTRQLNLNNYLTFLSKVAGDNVCKNFFGPEECSFWDDEHDHNFGTLKREELKSKGLKGEDIDSEIKKLAVETILKNPLQYTFLTAAEGAKLLFWESTQIGYVTYPLWLKNFFEIRLFNNGLRLLMFLLTFSTMLFAIIYVFKNQRNLYSNSTQENITSAFIFFSLIMIFGNIILYAPFKSVTRYAFQNVPLYIILIAYAFDRWIYRVPRGKT